MADSQYSNRLAVSEAAHALFPRGRHAASLSSAYRPSYPSGPRSAAVYAGRDSTHDAWFERSSSARKWRGVQTRRRIVDLDTAGTLRRPDNLCDLGNELRVAQRQAYKTGQPVYISPGLIAPPDLEEDYLERGWASPGVLWANFKPALLKVDYVRTKKWTVTVIQTASTHPDAVPDSLFEAEEFQICTYRFFLQRLVHDLKKNEYEGDRYLKHLTVKRTSQLWRYTGCYSKRCRSQDCTLNTELDADELQAALEAVHVPFDSKWLKQILFEVVPEKLEATRVYAYDSASEDSIVGGLRGLRF